MTNSEDLNTNTPTKNETVIYGSFNTIYMADIKFSEEWDKFRPERFYPGALFSTMRSARHIVEIEERAVYYEDKRGSEFHVILKGKDIATATLISVEQYYIDELPIEFLKQDTYWHYTRDDFATLMRRFYRQNDLPLIVLVFVVNEVFNKLYLMRRTSFEGQDTFLRHQIPREGRKTFFG